MIEGLDTIEKVAQYEIDSFLNPATKRSIARAEPVQLCGYHLNYGMSIRNRHGLWYTHPLTEKWRTDESSRVMQDMGGGMMVDYSPDHPDAVAMRVIERVWEIITGKTYVKPERPAVTLCGAVLKS